MAGPLIRFDLSLPFYFSYAPAPSVDTSPMIPRKGLRALFIRGEFGIKPDGRMRPLSAHNTTHMDTPLHFLADGADLASVLNRSDLAADVPLLAKVVSLSGDSSLSGTHTRDGVTYCEAVSAEVLPDVETLKNYDALVVLTGFCGIMSQYQNGTFVADSDGHYHIPHFTPSAVEVILASGITLVSIDSTTVEPQTSTDPVRFGSDVHFQLLGNTPPVFIVEGLGGQGLKEKVGFAPEEAILQMVPRRVNAVGAEAAHSRAFLYFYRDDPHGQALRTLAETIRPEEMYG